MHDGDTRRARHAAGRGKPGTHHEQGGAAPAAAAPPLLPSGWTMAASVALGMLLAGGASCALRGVGDRPGIEAAPALVEPEEQNVALWRAASTGCLEADRRWVQQISEGVLIAWCEAPSLGVVAVPRPQRRPSPSVATAKPQERAPEERVGSGQVDTESAAQGRRGAGTTDGVPPLSTESTR